MTYSSGQSWTSALVCRVSQDPPKIDQQTPNPAAARAAVRPRGGCCRVQARPLSRQLQARQDVR